jgi:2-oxo-4-hydroxy-4-carboxy-5-ureidoimidazoline decarboxylase
MNLDAMPESQAMEVLRQCCGSSRWVEAMMARRPFGSREAVLSAADEIWTSLDSDDWREAFAHHPRIGEQTTSSVATKEQSGVSGAAEDVRQALAKANRDYEQRFGYIYIVCATGKSAEEMLAIATGRLQNDPDTELRVAGEEQRKITRLRLQKLLED